MREFPFDGTATISLQSFSLPTLLDSVTRWTPAQRLEPSSRRLFHAIHGEVVGAVSVLARVHVDAADYRNFEALGGRELLLRWSIERSAAERAPVMHFAKARSQVGASRLLATVDPAVSHWNPR